MGYGPKRLAEIEAARKARKEEKARLKKEKEKEKKRIKALERKKRLKRLNNKRAYLKRRQAQLDMLKKTGDEGGYYTIIITKNNKKIRSIGMERWKLKAYETYNDIIEKNRQKTIFPKTIMTNRKNGLHEEQSAKYEILLVKKVNDGENTENSFRNKDGKFTKNIITDWKNHIILEKNDWLVEEKFGVYGYHPVKDRKPYTFILNELLLNNEDVGEEMRRVMVFKNKLIIQYLDDFDFVTCYNNKQAKRLYDKLEKDVSKLNKKYVVFMGETRATNIKKWLDKMEDKTGWKRNSLMHKTTAY